MNRSIFILIFIVGLTARSDELTTERAETIVNNILEDQAPNKFHFALRSGIFQLTQNSTDAINLNSGGLVPFFGFESSLDIYNNFGLEVRYYLAQNLIYESTTPEKNGTAARQTTFDVGVRYRWILDPTRTENYFAFKVMSHNYSNNYEVFDADDDTNEAVIYVKDYRAILAGVERGFYVTPIITVSAGLDVLFITGLSTDSALKIDQSGIGFQVRGEAQLDLDTIGLPGRLGGAYWQGVYTNEFKDVDDSDVESETTGKNGHVQAHRAISLSYTLLF